MPYAVTHVLTAVILVDLYRDYVTKYKKYFTLHTVFLAGVAGILPDIDVILGMIADIIGYKMPWLFQHGGITHTPLFGLLFLIPAYYFHRKGQHKIAVYFHVIMFGVLLHIFLDYFLGGGRYEGIMLFWPFATTAFKLHLLDYIALSQIPSSLDAIYLLLWLWHEEAKHRIRDFI